MLGEMEVYEWSCGGSVRKLAFVVGDGLRSGNEWIGGKLNRETEYESIWSSSSPVFA